MTYKTVDMVSTSAVFDEYIHTEVMEQHETNYVKKCCFSAFQQGIHYVIWTSCDRDIHQSLREMHVNSFVADISGINFSLISLLFFILIAQIMGIMVWHCTSSYSVQDQASEHTPTHNEIHLPANSQLNIGAKILRRWSSSR